jgi:hypothetical protein
MTARFVDPAFDSAHGITTNSIDLRSDPVRDLKARSLVPYSDQKFEAIKPIGPEGVPQALIIRQEVRIDSKMPAPPLGKGENTNRRIATIIEKIWYNNRSSIETALCALPHTINPKA